MSIALSAVDLDLPPWPTAVRSFAFLITFSNEEGRRRFLITSIYPRVTMPQFASLNEVDSLVPFSRMKAFGKVKPLAALLILVVLLLDLKDFASSTIWRVMVPVAHSF